MSHFSHHQFLNGKRCESSVCVPLAGEHLRPKRGQSARAGASSTTKAGPFCSVIRMSSGDGVAWCRIGPRPAGLTLFDLTWLNCFLIFRNLSNLLVLRMFNKCHSASPSDLRPEQPGHKATTGLDRPTRVFLGFLSDKISNPVDGHSADAANQKPKRCFRIAICLVVL